MAGKDNSLGRRFGPLEVVGRSERKTSQGIKFYNVLCHICKTDPELFGAGVFESTLSNLTSGQRPCGCAKFFHWTLEQQAVLARRTCAERGFAFVRMLPCGTVQSKNKAEVSCAEGHTWSVTLSNLKERGCPSCAKHGFKPDLPADLYVLRVCGTTEFCGFGITSEWPVRLKAHRLELAKKGFVISEAEVFSFPDGASAKAVESRIKAAFPLLPQDVPGFRREATLYHLYDEVVAFAEAEEAAKFGRSTTE